MKIIPGVQVHLSPIQEEYFLDNEKLIQSSSVRGNSVAAFDLPALVFSPCVGFLKDRFLARMFVVVMCAASKCSQLLGLELLLFVSDSASPWASVVQVSIAGNMISEEAGLYDQNVL